MNKHQYYVVVFEFAGLVERVNIYRSYKQALLAARKYDEEFVNMQDELMERKPRAYLFTKIPVSH